MILWAPVLKVVLHKVPIPGDHRIYFGPLRPELSGSRLGLPVREGARDGEPRLRRLLDAKEGGLGSPNMGIPRSLGIHGLGSPKFRDPDGSWLAPLAC